jgi:hypothetical protein
VFFLFMIIILASLMTRRITRTAEDEVYPDGDDDAHDPTQINNHHAAPTKIRTAVPVEKYKGGMYGWKAQQQGYGASAPFSDKKAQAQMKKMGMEGGAKKFKDGISNPALDGDLHKLIKPAPVAPIMP